MELVMKIGYLLQQRANAQNIILKNLNSGNLLYHFSFCNQIIYQLLQWF